jgi:hypothetical protein
MGRPTVSRAASIESDPSARGRASPAFKALLVVLAPASLCLALVWGTIAVSLEREWDDSLDEARKTVESSALLLEENLLRTFAIIDQATRVVRERFLAEGRTIDLARIKHEILGDNPLFMHVSVLDAGGTLIASSVPPPPEAINFADRDHFRTVLDSRGDGVVVSEPIMGRRSGKWTIQFTRRIQRPSGELAGVAVVSVDPFAMAANMPAVALRHQGSVSMVGLDGVLRVRVDSEGRFTIGEHVANWQSLARAQAGRDGWFRAESSIDGVARYFAYRRIGDYPLVVVAGISERDALVEYHRDRKRLLWFAIAVTLMILLSCIGGARVILQRERARIEAVRANHAKSVFLATMSHEVRTPLNGVLGLARALLGTDLAVRQREQVEMIRKSGDVLLSLLNDILDLSKVEAGKLEIDDVDFDLVELVRTIDAVWRPQAAAKGLRFSVVVGDVREPVLRGDPARVRQILSNLASNAVKFTETGGVELHVFQKRGIDHALETTFEVTDTGIGIAAQDQARLFRKFAQLDGSDTRRYGGAGLGLAISRSLAECMGGTVGVDSRPGEGSRFWLRLPCPPGNAAAIRPVWTQASVRAIGDRGGPASRLRILIAEDNRINQLVIRQMLEGAGHHVDVVDDGAQAVAAVARAPYDVVLMDVHMPEMDGLTATRRIRALGGRPAQVPIIAVTADAMVGDREAILAQGMNDYVSKPVDADALAAAIARQCGGRPVVQPFRGSRPETAPDPKDTRLAEFVDALDKAAGA